MSKISYEDVFYSPAGSCAENNSFFQPRVHKAGVATAWLCLGRGRAHTSGPASISPSGHQSLMPEGQALCCRMLTSLSPSLLAGRGNPCFEARWKHRQEAGSTAVLFWGCSGTPITLVHSHPAESGPLSDVYAHYNLRSSALANNPLGHLLFFLKF